MKCLSSHRDLQALGRAGPRETRHPRGIQGMQYRAQHGQRRHTLSRCEHRSRRQPEGGVQSQRGPSHEPWQWHRWTWRTSKQMYLHSGARHLHPGVKLLCVLHTNIGRVAKYYICKLYKRRDCRSGLTGLMVFWGKAWWSLNSLIMPESHQRHRHWPGSTHEKRQNHYTYLVESN